MMKQDHIWIRGAGELGSAVATILHRSGFNVFLSEISPPLAIRRKVTFSDAIIDRIATVDNISAKLFNEYQLPSVNIKSIPIYIDSSKDILKLKPKIIVDARMIKSYEKDYRDWAPLFIGLGPGFIAGTNCHAAIETKRGHSLGKIIWTGSPITNTGIPGNIGGESKRRVIFSPSDGTLTWFVEFGDNVEQDQIIGEVGNHQILATISGVVRGLIHPKAPIKEKLKIADIDPRKDIDYLSISDKANSVGRAVLETVMTHLTSK